VIGRIDERIAPALPGVPPPVQGKCRFCKADEARVDGDKLSWFGPDRTCCSQYDCIRQHWAEIDRAKRLRRPRKRTPADIHEIKLAERSARSRRTRDAAKARGLIRPKGGLA
jgi:hypothetical protein